MTTLPIPIRCLCLTAMLLASPAAAWAVPLAAGAGVGQGSADWRVVPVAGMEQAAHDTATTKAADLEIGGFWARAMLPGQPSGGGYLTIASKGGGDRLLSAASPAAAVTSPRVHCEGDLGDVRVEPFFPLPPAVRGALAARGLTLRDDLYGGRVCLIAVDAGTGRGTGASDPRGDGGLAEA